MLDDELREVRQRGDGADREERAQRELDDAERVRERRDVAGGAERGDRPTDERHEDDRARRAERLGVPAREPDEVAPVARERPGRIGRPKRGHELRQPAERRAADRAEREPEQVAGPHEERDRDDERRVEDEGPRGGHGEPAERLEVAGRHRGERAQREGDDRERHERHGERRRLRREPGPEEADDLGRDKRGQERDRAGRESHGDGDRAEQPSRSALRARQLEVRDEDRRHGASDQHGREEIGEAQREHGDVGVAADAKGAGEHDIAYHAGEAAGDHAEADDPRGPEDGAGSAPAAVAQFVPRRPTTTDRVRARIFRSVHTDAWVAYQRSNAIASSRPRELRPDTWARPVMPGRTLARTRRCSAV